MGAGGPATCQHTVGTLCYRKGSVATNLIPSLGPCSQCYLRGRRQTPSRCIQK